MKKMILSAWLMMLSIAAMAQSFVIVDKDGNKITYDVSKLEQITFQNDPPGFTVYEVVEETSDASGEAGESGQSEEPQVETTLYTFDEVASFAGDPDFLFAHPDTVYVGADGQDFAFQLRTNVAYDYKVSENWLQYSTGIAYTDSLCFEAGMNPLFEQRVAYIAFASADKQIADTLWVVQAGKTDSHYIPIDWSSTTLDSFNEDSGAAQLTFTGDVPAMGEYDVVLLPSDDSYVIRLIDNVQQAEGSKTVTLATREGVMGNLFKGKKFTLATEASANSNRRKVQGISDTEAIYTPVKVEVFTGEEYVEIYNVDKFASSDRRKAPVGFENEFINWEYNDDGRVLWEKGTQSLSWDKLNFNIGLKGMFSFDFGDVPWEKVRMGDLQNLKIALEGGFNMEMVMKYLVASSVEWKKEWTLKEDVFKAKYTFMVGTVPVYISVGADLMAEVSLGASGEASVTAGITASNTVTYGVEWDAEKGLSKIAECEKTLEMVGPDVDIKAHAEARATAYPKIEIGIYKVLCPTISPQPYLKAEADGRLVDNQYVAWNAGVSTGIDLGLGLCLDLFFWKKDLGEIDPINVFDLPIVSLPDEIELLNEKEEEMLVNGKKEVKYHVTNKNYITGTEYNAPAVLVHFEAEGGELEDEYGYTDKDGNVSAFFTLTDVKGGKITAEVVQGAEAEEGEEEDAIKADEWNAIAIQYRLQAEPGQQTIAKDAESATVTFKLEQYSSKTEAWAGVAGKTIYFEAKGGSCNASGVTTKEGIATATFTPEADFEEGSVTATITLSEPGAWSGIATGNIKAEGEDDIITDEGLKKALKQKENVYVIENKKTGETQERSYAPKYSEWRKEGKDFINFFLEDADAEGMTLGDAWGNLPWNIVNVVTALTGQSFENTPGGKFGFGVYTDECNLNAFFGAHTGESGIATEGNLKPESKILLRMSKRTEASVKRRAPGDEEYTGEYELLFYLVFENEEGDEYEVYGKGTMQMHVPTITSFQVQAEKDWVKVGESTKVNLQGYYEEEATWDWDDVEIKAQATNYEDARNGVDDGFFTWDATTQTLTSVKSNNNKDVYVRLGLKSKPGVQSTLSVATGEGWKYTMIKPSQEEHTYTGYGYMSFSFDFAPKASEDEKFDYNSLEIDPETNPNGYFSIPMTYAAQGWPLYVNSDTPAGEYTVRFWIKNNHAVSCTVKVIAYPEE